MNTLPIHEIYYIAKKDGWVMEYNTDLDCLYWSRPKISQAAKLRKFLDDFSLYITDEGVIEGLFIEYARGNFISHHKEYAQLLERMTSVDGERFILSEDKTAESEPLLKSISNMVGNEALDAVMNRGLKLEDVAFVS